MVLFFLFSYCRIYVLLVGYRICFKGASCDPGERHKEPCTQFNLHGKKMFSRDKSTLKTTAMCN